MSASDDGRSALLHVFRTVCKAQFAVDLQDGHACLASQDAEAMRRLAHNLKSVLSTLCEPAASACADGLEDALVRLDWPCARTAWQALRTHLQRVIGTPAH